MEIRNRETGAVITIDEFRAEHSRTSFPKKITAQILDGYGYDVIFNGPEAEVSGPYQYSQRDGIQEIGGRWFTKFVAAPTFTATAEKTAAEQEAEYRAEIDAKYAVRARNERDSLLAACDWAVMPDSPLTTEKKKEWKAYRQALRDISSAEGFPHTMEWPTKPD